MSEVPIIRDKNLVAFIGMTIEVAVRHSCKVSLGNMVSSDASCQQEVLDGNRNALVKNDLHSDA